MPILKQTCLWISPNQNGTLLSVQSLKVHVNIISDAFKDEL